jgi:sulfur relay (sulfurtransferase) complex TusBCD TusD component (DsrE family)
VTKRRIAPKDTARHIDAASQDRGAEWRTVVLEQIKKKTTKVSSCMFCGSTRGFITANGSLIANTYARQEWAPGVEGLYELVLLTCPQCGHTHLFSMPELFSGEA